MRNEWWVVVVVIPHAPHHFNVRNERVAKYDMGHDKRASLTCIPNQNAGCPPAFAGAVGDTIVALSRVIVSVGAALNTT